MYTHSVIQFQEHSRKFIFICTSSVAYWWFLDSELRGKNGDRMTNMCKKLLKVEMSIILFVVSIYKAN